MKLNETTKRLETEPGDSQINIETAENYNKLMDSLRWFFENGVKLSVEHKPDGYSLTFKS